MVSLSQLYTLSASVRVRRRNRVSQFGTVRKFAVVVLGSCLSALGIKLGRLTHSLSLLCRYPLGMHALSLYMPALPFAIQKTLSSPALNQADDAVAQWAIFIRPSSVEHSRLNA